MHKKHAPKQNEEQEKNAGKYSQRRVVDVFQHFFPFHVCVIDVPVRRAGVLHRVFKQPKRIGEQLEKGLILSFSGTLRSWTERRACRHVFCADFPGNVAQGYLSEEGFICFSKYPILENIMQRIPVCF